MKFTEINEKSVADLEKELKEKKLQLFALKAKLKTMQLSNPNEIRETRKDIARINTAIAAKRKGA
jgi:large subunit ribosomal protein L29